MVEFGEDGCWAQLVLVQRQTFAKIGTIKNTPINAGCALDNDTYPQHAENHYTERRNVHLPTGDAITGERYSTYSEVQQELRTRAEYNIIQGLNYDYPSSPYPSASAVPQSHSTARAACARTKGVCTGSWHRRAHPILLQAALPDANEPGGGPIPPVHSGSRRCHQITYDRPRRWGERIGKVRKYLGACR